ncbi:MAG: hypothetical protein N3I35_10860 [Clostridia bacterium]|nr:hypothetical protein [Clostridia bacterium]
MYKKELYALLASILIVFIFIFSRTGYSQEKLCLAVSSTNDKVRIAYKYDYSSDIWIDFKKVGINSIMGIESLHLASNKGHSVNPDLDRPSNLLLKSTTDWVGPYIVKSNSIKNNKKPSFTGGWHGSNGNSTGNSTARTLSLKVFTDKKQTDFNKTISCNKVNIDVVNLIAGYNTLSLKGKNREILKETVHYTITKGRIDVLVETQALDDVTIIKYYGLQTQNSAWKGKIYYIGGNNKEGFSSTKNSSSGFKRYYPNVSQFQIFSQLGTHKITAWIDRKYGIGNMELVKVDVPCAFTLSYGKSYFNLINGYSKLLKKGEKISWCGGYMLD